MAIVTWVVGKAGKLPIGKEANWRNKKRKTPDKSFRNEKTDMNKAELSQSLLKPNYCC